MASNKSSQAQKAASDSKKKSAAKSGSAKNATKSASAKNTSPKVQNKDFQRSISTNGAVALSCLGLFVLFLVISINPDGVFLQVFQSFFLGLFGKVGFYFSIPAFLYIFR